MGFGLLWYVLLQSPAGCNSLCLVLSFLYQLDFINIKR